MIKALEVFGMVGGLICLFVVVVLVGGAMLYMQLTKGGRNPFQ